jgi:hypothetical protein
VFGKFPKTFSDSRCCGDAHPDQDSFLLVPAKSPYAASSALQVLDTRVPDQEPDFIVLPCPATARGAMEKCATR